MKTILAALYRYHPFGGLQRDSMRLFEELAARGHHVIVFTAEWTGPVPDGITLEVVHPPRFASNHRRMKWFSVRFLERLKNSSAPHFDVSLAMSRIPGADFYFAADVCMKRYWSKLHPAWILRFLPRYRTYLKLEEGVCSPLAHTRILCLVQSQIDDYRREYGTRPERLQLLPPGMDPHCIRPDELTVNRIRTELRKNNNVSADEIVLVMIASSVFNKGTDRAITAAGNLPPSLKKRVRLWLIGNLPQKKLEEMLTRAGLLPNQAVFFGAVDGIRDYLLASDLMVHPARNEAAGMALIESVSAGTPVITTDICGYAPYIAESGNTVLKSPFSQTDLDIALEKTLLELSARRQATLAYAAEQDFTARTRVFADIITR